MIKYKDYGIQPNDAGGYVVGTVKKDKDGKDTLYRASYPSTITRALEIIRNEEFAKKIDSKDYTLEEAIKEFRDITNEIKGALKEAL